MGAVGGEGERERRGSRSSAKYRIFWIRGSLIAPIARAQAM